MQVKKYFVEKRGTVTYPDGSTEPVKYTSMEERPGSLVFHYGKGDWDVKIGYYSNTPYLEQDYERMVFSLANIESFEPDWEDELVAVAEIPDEYIEEVPLWRTLGLTTKKRFNLPDDFDPDVEVWERLEWEAYNG